MESKKKRLLKKIKTLKKERDEVAVASESSFPASDPPAYWASAPKDEPKKQKQSEKTDEKEND